MAKAKTRSTKKRVVKAKAKKSAKQAMAYALECGDAGESYQAFLWFCIGADGGEEEAQEYADSMIEIDQVSRKDVTLAHYQLAAWYHAGMHVPKDPRLALQHLLYAGKRAGLKLDGKALGAKDRSRALDEVARKIGLPKSTRMEEPLRSLGEDAPRPVVDRVASPRNQRE